MLVKEISPCSSLHQLAVSLLLEQSKPADAGTKVVVVTPKITVSLPDATSLDHGKMMLPKHVLQVGSCSGHIGERVLLLYVYTVPTDAVVAEVSRCFRKTQQRPSQPFSL